MLLSALLLALPVTALTAPGDLDPSFDGDGLVLTDFRGHERINALAVQPDGKLVAAGERFPDAALARYNPDGSLDSSFGADGRVVTDLSSTSEAINTLMLQPDGKLVAGGKRGFVGFADLILARYNADGSLDPSFGASGLVVVPDGFDDFDGARELVLQPDGKLVVRSRRSLSRFHSDGVLDTTFGGDGSRPSEVSSSSGRALVLQPDGKLVTAGTCCDGGFALERFNADGSPDTSFGSGGLVVTDLGGSSEVNALVLQADGKLVAAGRLAAERVLARYHPDGSLDTSFGTGGVVVTDGGGPFPLPAGWRALVLQTDGRLVAGAVAGFDGVLLARHNPDGSPDTSFGTGGAVALSDFIGLEIALVLQSDGKLVAGGRGRLSRDVDFTLARVLTTNERPKLAPKCGGRRATILGTSRKDTIRGTLGPDVILGRGGNDTIRGLAGNDTICGGPGLDTLIGNEGNDRLLGEGQNDKLFGDDGSDSLDGGSGRDACRTGETARRCEGQAASSKPTSGERPKDPPKPPCPPISNFPCS